MSGIVEKFKETSEDGYYVVYILMFRSGRKRVLISSLGKMDESNLDYTKREIGKEVYGWILGQDGSKGFDIHSAVIVPIDGRKFYFRLEDLSSVDYLILTNKDENLFKYLEASEDIELI